MKKFVLLIRGEDKFEALSPAEMQAVIGRYMAWAQRLREEGRLVDSEGLAPDSRLLRGEGGKILVTDGPYAETKDMIGGYYVFRAEDFDEAVEIAKACPALDYGGNVELRTEMDYA